jgi:Flp pilus assembly protein TadB
LVNNAGVLQAAFRGHRSGVANGRKEQNVSSGHGPSWERLLAWLVVAAIAGQILVSVLPRLLVPIVVLAGVVGLLRLLWSYTNRY